MSNQAPFQLFDNSQQEALTQTPELKSAPKTIEPPQPPPQLDAPDYDPDDEEWRDFDWEAYHKRLLKQLPSLGEIEKRYPHLCANRGLQLWIARHLPPPLTRWLLSDLPTKSLWQFINLDTHKQLKYEALRGFQQTPGSLRREPVQKRIAAWLLNNPDEVHQLMLRWALAEPPVLEAILTQPDEATLKGRLPSLIRAFGLNEARAALAFGGKTRLFQYLSALVEEDAKLAEFIENAPPYSPDAPQVEAVAPPQPDSSSAKFWQAETCQLRDDLEQTQLELEAARAGLARGENARARVQTLEAEIEKGKRRETQKAAQSAKKLEQIERKWAAKYEELGKVEAREERRVRAMQTQIEELELDNKRQKKQLRQSAQSREEERRKVVALEAKLAELQTQNADKPAAALKSMDAVSSPPTTQDAPNRPVKVSKPSPLDEIFEWMAHGHRIRVTAREVRRLIDKNDEARVGNLMLELEALQESNPDLRRRFLERLKQAGAHYPRVLTHRTSRVLVDASNVARFRANKYGKGHLADLQLMRQELQRLDCWPIVFIADASLPYYIDEPGELREMARQGEIIIVDKGVEADEILAREARATGAYVVTNDAKFFYKVSPDYEPPRITFRVLDGLVVVDEF